MTSLLIATALSTAHAAPESPRPTSSQHNGDNQHFIALRLGRRLPSVMNALRLLLLLLQQPQLTLRPPSASLDGGTGGTRPPSLAAPGVAATVKR